MKLYYTKRSPYARKVRIVALEKNIHLDLVEEDLAHKSQELVQANPVGKIPVLVGDDGQAIVESSLICDYLDFLNPEPSLIPTDPRNRWALLNLDAMATSLTDVAVAGFCEKLYHPNDFNEGVLRSKEETIVRTLDYLEQYTDDLQDLSIASISVVCAIGYVALRYSQLWPQEGCPRLVAWYESWSQRPSVEVTVPVIS